MKSKLIDIFYFALAGSSGTLAVLSLIKDQKLSSISLDVLWLLISIYFIIRGFMDINDQNKKLSHNWKILSWISWIIMLLSVFACVIGYRNHISELGWGGFVIFLLCCFIVPEQENDKNLHVKKH